MITKLKSVLFVILCLAVAPSSYATDWLGRVTDVEINASARQSVVQILDYTPGLFVKFTDDYLVKEETVEIKIQKAIDAYEAKKTEQEDKYNSYLTEVETYGHKSVSANHIVLGSIDCIPKYAKFPKRVLVVYKTEKKEINPWDEEYAKDVMAVSTTANVSISTAKDILSNIKNQGFSITKTEIEEDTGPELLWFDDGWDDKFPMKLDWEVKVEDKNIITGYDPMGILTVEPIPQKSYNEITPVYVKVGYIDMKDEYKKTDYEKKLEKEAEDLKAENEKLKKEINGEETQLDITKATWADLVLGVVEVIPFWSVSSGSGVYLGNHDYDIGKIQTFTSGFLDLQGYNTNMRGVVLTNAHVVSSAINVEMLVSEDKTAMVIFAPSQIAVRFSKDSTRYGTPAALMMIDYSPVMSWEYDTALVVTTELSRHEKYATVLGNSDNVHVGDEVISVGHPLGLGKMNTKGIVSNTNFSLLDSVNSSWMFKYMDDEMYKWYTSSCFHFDTPIGVGGVSGSGVYALTGSERGKMIALRNAGMVSYSSGDILFSSFENYNYTTDSLYSNVDNSLIAKNKDKLKDVFKDKNYTDVKFNMKLDEFKDDSFKDVFLQQRHAQDASGLNIGIPINKVKSFLEECGINPQHLNWEPKGNSYWEK